MRYLSCGGKFTHFAFVKQWLECVNCGDLYRLTSEALGAAHGVDEYFCSQDCDYEYHGLQANCGGCGNSYPIEGDDTGYCCVECEEDTMICENCGKPGTRWLEELNEITIKKKKYNLSSVDNAVYRILGGGGVGVWFCSEQCCSNY